jgi:hypothetical protein
MHPLHGGLRIFKRSGIFVSAKGNKSRELQIRMH